MENNLLIIEKKAIDAALNNNWEDALKLNSQILNSHPNNIGAKIRLGKAQIQTKKFKDAINTFNEVLKIDPINKIAVKNLQVAKDKKITQANIKADKLIIEPGMTTELVIKVSKNIPFEMGQNLDLILNKSKVELNYKSKLFSTLDNPEIEKILVNALKNGVKIECSVIKIKDKNITLLLSSDTPIFKSEKQSVKPYLKKGTVEDEEPELDMGTEQND